ncbi:MAG: hypothetical protein IJD60_02630 [Clostridia bacterium]|nr:hypothetical protein [Clostridia bacterium]
MMKDKKMLLRDPLRFAMMAQPCPKVRLALMAALMAACYLIMLKLCAGMEGAAVIAAAGTGCTALLTGFAWHALREQKQPVVVLLCMAGLAALAVGAHLAMLDIKPGRFTNLLEPMLADMWNYEMLSGMAWEDGSWSGVYLIVMALVSYMENFSQLYALKLFDMACQCLAACAVLKLALRRGAGAHGAIAAMFACVLAPTMLMNAGLWAQCDATFAMFTIWGLYCLLSDRPLAGCILWGFALGTKLQSAFLFPLLIVLFMKNRVQLRHILALAAAAFLCQMAIVLDGQGVYALVSRYAMQLEDARWSVGLADNAPGVYGLMKVASVREFSGMGLYLGIACALLVVGALLRTRSELNADVLLLGALLLACGLPLILPQMNARSLYLAGMLAFACAGNARRMAAAGLLEFISLCSYMQGIFGHTVLPMTVLSLLAIGAALIVLLELLALLCPKAHEEARQG